jgi:hypothetical protein
VKVRGVELGNGNSGRLGMIIRGGQLDEEVDMGDWGVRNWDKKRREHTIHKH